MGIESSFNYISDLDASNPDGTDNANMGDDHIRGIKNVLVTTFPNISGVVTATHTELSFVSGVTSAIQTQFSALDTRITSLESSLPAPSGTKLVFYQASPPTGWTQDTANNDYMMRVVSTSGGGTGGSDSPILNNKVASHTHPVTGSTDTDGTHNHPIEWASSSSTTHLDASAGYAYSGSQPATGAHSHSFTTTTSANTGAANWTPKYLDVIVASKD